MSKAAKKPGQDNGCFRCKESYPRVSLAFARYTTKRYNVGHMLALSPKQHPTSVHVKTLEALPEPVRKVTHLAHPVYCRATTREGANERGEPRVKHPIALSDCRPDLYGKISEQGPCRALDLTCKLWISREAKANGVRAFQQQRMM